MTMNAFSCGLSKSLKKFNLLLSRAHITYFSGLTSKNHHTHSSSLPEKFASCLDNCSDYNSIKELHACVITRGLENNVLLGSKLVTSFARLNLLVESKWVFNKIVNDDLVLWNSVIVGFFRAYQYSEVLGFYLDLRQKNIGVHSSAVTFVLKSCVELGDYKFGRNIHADVFKFGLTCDKFLGSSLMVFYSKFDQIGEASKVFDEMIERDVVAYTSVITGYARAGDDRANKAFGIVRDMQERGYEPNRVTLVSLLQCASRLGALEEGKSIHGYAVRKGIGYRDEVFETSLMDMYIKCGDPDKCSKIFRKMTKTTSASWNALVSGHLRMGQTLEALEFFLEMVHDKCELDLVALANGLLICADLGYLLMGKTMHCYILRRGFQLDLVGTTTLVDMYSKCKHLSEAANIFFRTEEKDSVLFDAMIYGYLYNSDVFKAMETFHELVTMGIKPNTSTIIRVLSALSEKEDIRSAKCIHGYVFKQGLGTNTDIANQLVNVYGKCGSIECAKLAFDRIKFKDRVSWTSIMTGLVNNGLAHEAMTLLPLMQRENISPDSVTFTSLLQALNQLGSVNLVREVHGHMYRLFIVKDTTLMNSLITTYSKFGKLKAARNLFEHVDELHLSSWNTMIAAHGMHGDCVKALELFDQMKKQNIAPDGVTLKTLLSSCSHTGFVEEGLNIFSSMEEEHGIVPSDEHYGCVVDMLGRAGQVREAYNLLNRVPFRQNASILGSLLAACRIHGDSEIGERVGKWLLDVEPQNTSAYCSVSNFYAGRERWEDVAYIGAAAKVKGLKRATGCSLVDAN